MILLANSKWVLYYCTSSWQWKRRPQSLLLGVSPCWLVCPPVSPSCTLSSYFWLSPPSLPWCFFVLMCDLIMCLNVVVAAQRLAKQTRMSLPSAGLLIFIHWTSYYIFMLLNTCLQMPLSLCLILIPHFQECNCQLALWWSSSFWSSSFFWNRYFKPVSNDPIICLLYTKFTKVKKKKILTKSKIINLSLLEGSWRPSGPKQLLTADAWSILWYSQNRNWPHK